MSAPRLGALDHVLFRRVLSALSEPGTPQAAPDGLAGEKFVAGIAQAIWEADTPVWTAPGLPQLPGRPVGAADAAVLYTTGDDAARLGMAGRGTAVSPELAATILLVPVHPGVAVWLDGPGIPAVRHSQLPMTREAVLERNRRCAEPPLGIDIVIVDDNAIIGLPRTTIVELADD